MQQSGAISRYNSVVKQEPGAAPPPSGQAVPPSSGQAAPLSHATVGANAMQTLHSGATVGANAMHVTSEPQQLQHLQLVAHETPQTRGGAGIRRAASSGRLDSSACLVTQAIQMGMKEESRGGRRDWEGVLARSDTHARSVVKLCETISKTVRVNLTKTHITTTKSLFTNCNNILSELRSDEGDASIGPKISLAETHSKFLEQYQDNLELHFKFKNRKINSMKAYESHQALVVEVRKHRGALSKWEVQELQEMPWMREDRTKWGQAYVVSIGDIARLLFLVSEKHLTCHIMQKPGTDPDDSLAMLQYRLVESGIWQVSMQAGNEDGLVAVLMKFISPHVSEVKMEMISDYIDAPGPIPEPGQAPAPAPAPMDAAANDLDDLDCLDMPLSVPISCHVAPVAPPVAAEKEEVVYDDRFQKLLNEKIRSSFRYVCCMPNVSTCVQ